MPWQLVIFDNDGVLVDSERLANEVLANILTELWRPTTFEECVATYLGGTIERVRERVEAESGRPLPAGFEDRYHRELFAAFDDGLTAVPGAADVLEHVSKTSLKYCVASSGTHQRIERTLQRVGLWPHFAGRVFSAEDVAHGKPAPDLFLHAARTLKTDPAETVVVEDSPLGVEAARAAGMKVIGFAAVTPADRLAGATIVVATMAELDHVLTRGGTMGPVDSSPFVKQEHLDALCPELAAVVEDAVASGNEVAETWTGYGQAVRLKGSEPVLVAVGADIRGRLRYRSVRDAHYWLGEIHCRTHPDWFVALSFDRPDAREPEGLPPA